MPKNANVICEGSLKVARSTVPNYTVIQIYKYVISKVVAMESLGTVNLSQKWISAYDINNYYTISYIPFDWAWYTTIELITLCCTLEKTTLKSNLLMYAL